MLFKGLGLLFNCLERKCLLLLPFYLTCDTPHLLNVINVCESLRPVGSIGIQCELKQVVEDQKPSVGVIGIGKSFFGVSKLILFKKELILFYL